MFASTIQSFDTVSYYYYIHVKIKENNECIFKKWIRISLFNTDLKNK